MSLINNVSFTGWSPSLGTANANQGAASGSVQRTGFSQMDKLLSDSLRKPGARFMRALITTLLGATAGSTATANRTRRVGASMIGTAYGNGGGVVSIAAEGQPELGGTTAGRATVSGDTANINAYIINRLSAIAATSYPADTSKNGGGRVNSTAQLM